eukprot:31018-Pelagococcus_subviridis.AAC.26
MDPGRRETTAKVLKERRSPRQRGRMGTSRGLDARRRRRYRYRDRRRRRRGDRRRRRWRRGRSALARRLRLRLRLRDDDVPDVCILVKTRRLRFPLSRVVRDPAQRPIRGRRLRLHLARVRLHPRLVRAELAHELQLRRARLLQRTRELSRQRLHRALALRHLLDRRVSPRVALREALHEKRDVHLRAAAVRVEEVAVEPARVASAALEPPRVQGQLRATQPRVLFLELVLHAEQLERLRLQRAAKLGDLRRVRGARVRVDVSRLADAARAADAHRRAPAAVRGRRAQSLMMMREEPPLAIRPSRGTRSRGRRARGRRRRRRER